MKRRLFTISIIVSLSLLMMGSASECNATTEEKKYTEQIKEQSLDTVGLPNISNFFEMAQLKEIYEMRDDPNLVMYYYTQSENGLWNYQGECIGYGIPAGVSITSPDVYEYNGATVAQAEPNGLYTNGVTTSATWVLSVNPYNGEIQPVYSEVELHISQFPMLPQLCEPTSLWGIYDTPEFKEMADNLER